MRISDTNPQEEVVIDDIEIKVTGSFDEAVKKFKSLVQKEKILNDYRQRMAYEKPSVKRRRKTKEAQERKFAAEAREQQMLNGEWEKRQKKKELKRLKKIEAQQNKEVKNVG